MNLAFNYPKDFVFYITGINKHFNDYISYSTYDADISNDGW